MCRGRIPEREHVSHIPKICPPCPFYDTTSKTERRGDLPFTSHSIVSCQSQKMMRGGSYGILNGSVFLCRTHDLLRPCPGVTSRLPPSKRLCSFLVGVTWRRMVEYYSRTSLKAICQTGASGQILHAVDGDKGKLAYHERALVVILRAFVVILRALLLLFLSEYASPSSF